jgi:hypothetical protein
VDDFDKTLADLKDEARMERWDRVDLAIRRLVSDPRYYRWAAKTGINEANGDVRDLAVSIIEMAEIPAKEFDGMRGALFGRMMCDENEYVRYRSAFALAKHESGQYKERVKVTLREASNDKDVGEIAKFYLRQMEPKRITSR